MIPQKNINRAEKAFKNKRIFTSTQPQGFPAHNSISCLLFESKCKAQIIQETFLQHKSSQLQRKTELTEKRILLQLNVYWKLKQNLANINICLPLSGRWKRTLHFSTLSMFSPVHCDSLFKTNSTSLFACIRERNLFHSLTQWPSAFPCRLRVFVIGSWWDCMETTALGVKH